MRLRALSLLAEMAGPELLTRPQLMKRAGYGATSERTFYVDLAWLRDNGCHIDFDRDTQTYCVYSVGPKIRYIVERLANITDGV